MKSRLLPLVLVSVALPFCAAAGQKTNRAYNEESKAAGAAAIARDFDSYRKKVTGPSGKTIDITKTLRRIAKGETLEEAGLRPHSGDGTVFLNLPDRGTGERPLPEKPKGYYIEYVNPPAPGVRWPGPERIIVGKKGEAYYSPQHYDPATIVALHKGEK